MNNISNEKIMDLMKALGHAEHYFQDSVYQNKLDAIRDLYRESKYKEMEEALNALPDTGDLLAALIEKLKGKPAYKTLKKVALGKNRDAVEELKAWSSLMTHTCIEMEHNRIEYKMLAELIYEKQGEILLGYL